MALVHRIIPSHDQIPVAEEDRRRFFGEGSVRNEAREFAHVDKVLTRIVADPRLHPRHTEVHDHLPVAHARPRQDVFLPVCDVQIDGSSLQLLAVYQIFRQFQVTHAGSLQGILRLVNASIPSHYMLDKSAFLGAACWTCLLLIKLYFLLHL